MRNRAILSVFFCNMGCGRLSEPPNLLSEASSTEGRDAFFEALKTADYASLDDSIELLTQEYLDGDDVSTATLGFAHAWKLAEFERVEDGPARVIESADLAVRYFEEASEAFPDDPRLRGFLGSFKQAQGSIHDHPELERKGWFDQRKAVRAWPEWGLFTQAYGLVTLDPEEKRYQKGIELLWQNIDECIDGKVDREKLDYLPHAETVQKDDDMLNHRACANTDVVPYNVQGFFMVFGDMLGKASELETAKLMYQTAVDLPDSGDWPYLWLAQDRLNNLDDLPEYFAEDSGEAETTTIFNGPYSCTICHSSSDDSF